MSSIPTVACFLTDGFEDEEFAPVYAHLLRSGLQVDVLGVEKGLQLEGKHREETVLVDKAIEEAVPSSYSALWIPGGHSPDALRADSRFVGWLKAFAGLHRPMAASGHGPQLWLTADLVDNRLMTASPTVQGDLQKAGARVVDKPWVVDGTWLSARNLEAMEAFAAAFVKMII